MEALQLTEEFQFSNSEESQYDPLMQDEEEEYLEAPFGVVSSMYAQFRDVERIDPEIINLMKNKFKVHLEINKVSKDMNVVLQQAK